MKKIIILFTLCVLVLSGCSVETSSSSSSSMTITTTDENGNSTTTTTTTENGVTTTDTITTSADDPTGLRNLWTEVFSEGAEGISKDGYPIYFAYNDPDDITTAAIMIMNEDKSELLVYIYGEVVPEDDHFKIVDVDEKEDGTKENLPFVITDTAVENGFEMEFKDGDSVYLGFVSQETIIDDMISIWEVHQEAYQNRE